MYSKKFDEFQGTVSKSNSIYSGFKQDMDKVRPFLKNVMKLKLFDSLQCNYYFLFVL